MSVKISPILPAESVVPSIKSASAHVQRRRSVEVQPQSQVTYSWTTNSQIIFDINSPSDFWDMMNSYLRFDLECDLTNGGNDVTRRYLSEGGAHSLFRTIEISTQSGVLLQRMDRYNKWYSIMSSGSHSREHVDLVLSRAGDSADIEAVMPATESVEWQNLTITTLTFDATGNGSGEQYVEGVGTRFSTELQVGDLVLMADPAGADNAIIGEVGSITDDTEMFLAWSVGTGDVDLVATASVLKRKRPGRNLACMRRLAANTDDIVLCMQPALPLLQMNTWFPLFLVRGGLRITFTLDRPEFCLVAPEEPTGVGFKAANVQIKNPVYVCSMVTPDQSLSQQYLDMYRGSGLNYNFLGFRHYLDIQSGGGVGTHVSQMNANVRSARMVLGRIQNLRAETVSSEANSGKSTFTCDSIAQGLKAGLQEYQFQAGSERFPQAKAIDCTDISNSEAFSELQRVMNKMGSVVHSYRFQPAQWQERSHYINEYEATQATDSQRLIISADLSRDSSPWCGLDLSLNNLQAELVFDAPYEISNKDGSSNTAGDRYISLFLGYDALLSISEQGVVLYS